MKNRLSYFMQFSPYMAQRKTDLYIWALFELFIKILVLVNPFIYIQLIDKIMVENQLYFLKYVIASILIVYFLSGIAKIVSWKFHNRFFLNFEKNLQNVLLNKYLDMPNEKIPRSDLGNLKKTITEDAATVLVLVEKNIFRYLLSIITIFSLSILLFVMSPILAMIAYMFIPLSFRVTKKIGRKAEQLTKDIRNTQGEYEKLLYNLLGNWEFIKYNHLFSAVIGKVEIYWQKLSVKILKKQTVSFANRAFISFKDYIVLEMGLYFIGGILVFSNKLTIVSLIAFMGYLSVFLKSVTEISDNIFEYYQNLPQIQNVVQTINIDIPQHKILQYFSSVKLQNVSVSFEDSCIDALSDINLTIKKGEHIVITGHNGSGKTTLLRTIMGMQPIQKGNIQVNDIPIREINEKSIYKIIRYLPQTPHFINGTIKDNLSISNPEISEDRMIEACEKVNLLSFIQKLPQKFDTKIHDSGIRLSGGQKQRLAIARLILADPDVLVLDEITASMDEENSQMIQNIIQNEFRDKTLIAISHKWSEINTFSRIIIVKSGKIAADTPISNLDEAEFYRLFDL